MYDNLIKINLILQIVKRLKYRLNHWEKIDFRKSETK